MTDLRAHLYILCAAPPLHEQASLSCCKDAEPLEWVGFGPLLELASLLVSTACGVW